MYTASPRWECDLCTAAAKRGERPARHGTSDAIGRAQKIGIVEVLAIVRQDLTACSDQSLKPAPFDIVIVHSGSRLFRDTVELACLVCRTPNNGIRSASIVQAFGDDPTHAPMRQVMTLFDE
ncbi:MAG: hypothetical protein KGK10_07055 [Rhodospirillales bacterium]|nr:hypothetical protein [Rhodospirillales bacterium]